MSCSFEHFDGAYVLGALSAADRLEFEQHLSGCGACTARVRQLAGLPGLLGRIAPEVLDEDVDLPPLPDTLLPALCDDARRTERRQKFLTAGVAAVAAALAVGLGAIVVSETSDRPAVPEVTSDPGPDTSEEPRHSMRPVGAVPVRASLVLEPVRWGTRIDLLCTYDPSLVDYELPTELTYLLVIRTRAGATEQVGTWRSVGGRTLQLEAATATRQDDIASVEIRTPDGRVVLRSSA